MIVQPTRETTEAAPRRPLRLWPGVVIVALQWLVRFVLPLFSREFIGYGIIGGVAGGLLVLVWWIFFSRAPWSERLGAVLLMGLAVLATYRIADVSITTGAQGMLLVILAIPVLSLALVVWAAATRNLSDQARRGALVVTVLLATGVWALVRTGGFTGSFENDLRWRWAKTSEDRLLEQAKEKPAEAPAPAPAPAPAVKETPEKEVAAKVEPTPAPRRPARAPVETVPEWGGFRGPHRDGALQGVKIETDWSASPPAKLWRRPIGPGWSSFAVEGDHLFTQEQRGPDEVVACYKVSTGEPVWIHRDKARFWESNAGPGPRGTPSLGHGMVYTFGATGILNALDATDGSVVWSRNSASELSRKIPDWGFASSPLLFQDLVIVAVSGQLAAYDAATGNPRWTGPRGGTSYSSPHLITNDGVSQILLLNAGGVTSVAPADGKVLWEHAWPGYPIVQPGLTADGDVLLSVSDKSGIRRLGIAHESGGWHTEERWTSPGLKPYFNDFVVHNGHAFGFDGSILACIDLSDGKRKWKGGRYGHGQLILLPDEDLLLVLSEEGELALVKAVPDGFTEVAKAPAIEGKTWNHPVLAGDVLLVRNGEEMAAFRLALARR